MRKKTYEEVKHYIEVESNSGCKLESNEYINNTTLLDLMCKCGNSFKTTFGEFKQQKRYLCSSCSNLRKYNKIYPKERVELIITLYNQNKTLEEISKIVGNKPQTVSKILKENNIALRNVADYYTSKQLATNKKYDFNEDYFEVIDDEVKAYWLGFIFADGNVYVPKYKEGKTKGGRLDIALKAEDDYHLWNFRNDINGNMDVVYRDMKLGDKIYPSCRITVNSIKMAQDLIKHGCTPKKSLTLEFPPHLSEEMLPHFIRGYIDGDGCVFFKIYEKIETFHVSLLGTVEFLTGVKNILEKNNIKCANIKPQKSNAFSFHIFGRDNLVKLYNYLYGNASVFLGRKIDLYRQAMLYFDKDFKISPTAKLFCKLDDKLEEFKFEKWFKKTDMYKQLQEFRKSELYDTINNK